MRSLFAMFIVFVLAVTVVAQQRVPVPAHLKNYKVESTINVERDHAPGQLSPNPYVSNNKAITETTIGTTEYDVQSNKSVDTRIFLYDDGTIGATWNYGTGGMADRGSGYNYYDGTSWGAIPSSRVENRTAGWASYYPMGNGEIIISHAVTAPYDLLLSKRATKGTGTWTQTSITSPAPAELSWPRTVVVGDTIHVISCAYIDNYQNVDNAIIYSRSLDGGSNWAHEVLPGMDFASNQFSYGGDTYAWATPQDGSLAFIVGNMWHDIFIMKSTDGGDNWTKIPVFNHPNPFTFETLVPLDTTYVTDGLLSVEFDNSGSLHAAFGAVRVLVEDPSAETFSWFPFVSYVGYWNESMGALTDLDIDVMDANGRLIGWIMDLDGSGTIYDTWGGDFAEFISYGNHALVSQPQITIDDDDDIYVTFAHVNETNHSGTAFYRHIWARKSTDGGTTWSDFTELTYGVTHEFSECVYGAMAKNSDDYLHITYQLDDLPGSGTGAAPDHTQQTNEIVYIRVNKTDIGDPSFSIEEYNTINGFSVYPNPASEFVTINVVSPVRTVANVTISNIMGQVVYSQNLNVNVGSSTSDIGLENIPSGVYVVTLQAGSYKNSQKLIVQ